MTVYRFLKKIASLPIIFYRKFISPHKAPCCRFTPSCSKYALEAVDEWGIIIGFFMSIWRILRCNPFCRGGYDPVPKRKEFFDKLNSCLFKHKKDKSD